MMRTSKNRLTLLDEPELEFGFGQRERYSKDGLLLFGPPTETGQPTSIRYGVVGTLRGQRLFRDWVSRIQRFIPSKDRLKPHFQYWPGFTAVYGAEWPLDPLATLTIDEIEFSRLIRLEDRHHAIYDTASLVTTPIEKYRIQEERQPDVWFVVIPDEVHRYGRPRSSVPKTLREHSGQTLGRRGAERFLELGDLFDDFTEEARKYQFDLDFHAQLKARLLGTAVIQIVRESTLTGGDYIEDKKLHHRRMQDPATTAWNLCTTTFFKSQGSPWRLYGVRKGVCYIGLVYKRDDTHEGHSNVCCGAQMFLDSGDGVVFRGAMGPWDSANPYEYHLSRDAAKSLMDTVLDAYVDKHDEQPTEVFIHGQTNFNDEEWAGFSEAVDSGIQLNGVKIRKSNRLKVYRAGRMPLVRGSAWELNERQAFLWTSGYVPRLATYPGWEVPNPLEIELQKGSAEIGTVLNDVLGLTKLNYNACIFGDSKPVTLKFADAVGSILTATPDKDQPPLPFKYYI